MARIRTIKPEFWTSKTLAKVSRDSRLTFIGLWNLADDLGILLDLPRKIAADLYPHEDITLKQINGWLDELVGVGLIVRVIEKSKNYIIIRSWDEHQRIDHPGKNSLLSRDSRDSLASVSRLEKERELEDGNRKMEMEEERECRGKTKKPDDDTEIDVSLSVAASRGVKPRASAMKANFELPESWRDWCKTHRPELNPDAVADEFRDYWLGNGKRMIDWQATWRNWVRRQAPPKSSTQAKPRNAGNAGAVTEALERFRHRALIIEGECYDA